MVKMIMRLHVCEKLLQALSSLVSLISQPILVQHFRHQPEGMHVRVKFCQNPTRTALGVPLTGPAVWPSMPSPSCPQPLVLSVVPSHFAKF